MNPIFLYVETDTGREMLINLNHIRDIQPHGNKALYSVLSFSRCADSGVHSLNIQYDFEDLARWMTNKGLVVGS